MNVHIRHLGPPQMARRRVVRAREDDFGAVMRPHRSRWPLGALRETLAQGPTSTRFPWAGPEGGTRRGSGGGAHRAGELPPCGEPGERRRQVQDDAAHRALDPHREAISRSRSVLTWAWAHAVPRAR